MALLAVRKPVAGLLVWMVLLPVQFDTVRAIGFRFAPADVVLPGLVIATVVRGLEHRSPWPGADGILRAALALLVALHAQ